MEKIELTTDFVCVATSGRTADGRTITPEQLNEMAESYDPNLYTALIWLEHSRWVNNFGRVTELKAVEENGKTKLYAKLAPTAEMISLNKKGVGLFTSIEITPDFSDLGKHYLTGLAITDSPASTGTTALMFSRIGSNDVIVGDHYKLNEGWLGVNDETEKEQVKKSFFTQMFNYLFGEHSPTPNSTPQEKEGENATNGKNETQEFSEMTKEERQEFANELAKAMVTAMATAQTEAAQFNKAEPATEKTATAEKTAETVTAPVEEYNQLKATVEELKNKFNTLQTQPVTDVPSVLGGEFKFNLPNGVL